MATAGLANLGWSTHCSSQAVSLSLTWSLCGDERAEPTFPQSQSHSQTQSMAMGAALSMASPTVTTSTTSATATVASTFSELNIHCQSPREIPIPEQVGGLDLSDLVGDRIG